MLKLAGLLIVAVALALAVNACGADEDGSVGAPQPTAFVAIDDVGCEVPPNDEATGNCTLRDAIDKVNAGEADIINFHAPAAAIRAEAERVCPAGADACISAYVSQAASTHRAVLCVSESSGTWYLATPDATPDAVLGQEGSEASAIGDDCRQAGHVAVAVVGGSS